jgi:hypothetical protein
MTARSQDWAREALTEHLLSLPRGTEFTRSDLRPWRWEQHRAKPEFWAGVQTVIEVTIALQHLGYLEDLPIRLQGNAHLYRVPRRYSKRARREAVGKVLLLSKARRCCPHCGGTL